MSQIFSKVLGKSLARWNGCHGKQHEFIDRWSSEKQRFVPSRTNQVQTGPVKVNKLAKSPVSTKRTNNQEEGSCRRREAWQYSKWTYKFLEKLSSTKQPHDFQKISDFFKWWQNKGTDTFGRLLHSYNSNVRTNSKTLFLCFVQSVKCVNKDPLIHIRVGDEADERNIEGKEHSKAF